MGWTAQDVEAACCCLCEEEGEVVHDLAPFRIVRCPRCTLHFTSPRLRPDALQRQYDGADYFESGVYGRHRWSPALLLQRVWTAGRLRLIARATRQPQGRRLLEIGCGYGLFLGAARDRGYTTVGVELSTAAVAHARDVLDLDVHAGHLENAPLEGPFDVIAVWDTIEHVPDPLDFMRTVASLLPEDGIVVFSTPYMTSLPARLLGARWRALRPAEHIWHFSVETHALLAERAGLELRHVITSPIDTANLTRLDSLVGIIRPA